MQITPRSMHTQILNNILPAKLLKWIVVAALTIEFSLHERHEWFWLITMQYMLIKCSRTSLLELINPLYSTSRQNKQSSNWIVVLKTTTTKLLVNKHWWQDTEVSCHFNILVGPMCIEIFLFIKQNSILHIPWPYLSLLTELKSTQNMNSSFEIKILS